jgi:hypothetical protein
MTEITYGRSPQEVKDDFVLQLLDMDPAQDLDELLGMSTRQLNARAYALEGKKLQEERAKEWRRTLRTFAPERPFYNGRLH